jgi:hypothetical protein
MAHPTRDELVFATREAVRTTAPGDRPDLMGVQGGDLMNVRAREAIAQAIRSTASAQEQHVLVAAFVLRLAQLGHTKEVTIKVAGGEEAARAVLASLAEMGARPQDARERDGAGPDGGRAVPTPAHALGSVHKRARACLECGRDFEVNPRHAESHRFHSAACRSRYRRTRRDPMESRDPIEGATP